ncbi:MAG TPA: hypothetical protein DEO70_05475 [Bacteroidales bacterium]|nr:MAG: hypothetical protein A2X11_16785 [Bacteroidetes bacterium GWE2_42_24]OFY25146.1 MAG: hypothetical protein A2X09_04945 [Bacteroidetes bacterium GWF2_43_11]HBZ66269.1 hypothetical protein [Bacteroidales bacterium]
MKSVSYILVVVLCLVSIPAIFSQSTVQPDSTCAGNAGEIYMVNLTSGSTYNWSVTGTGNTLHSSGTNEITIDWSVTAGVDTVKVVETDLNGCPGDLVKIAVVRIPIPIANAGADDTICSSGTFAIAAATAQNYKTLLWSTSGDGSFIDGNALTPEYTPGPGDIATGSVNLTLTANPNTPCAIPTTDVMRLVLIPAIVVNAGTDDTLCWDETVYMDDPSVTNSTTYAWSTSGDGAFDNTNLLNATYNPGDADNTSGSVTLTLTATGNEYCPDVSDVKLLNIRPKPVTSAIQHF